MSALAIEPTTTEGGPADAASASRRVQQLQTLVAQAASGSTASFAAALSAASGASSAVSQGPTPAGEGTSVQTTGQSSALPTAATTTAAAYVAPTTASLPASAVPVAGVESAGASTYDAAIAQAAARNGIEPALLHGLIQQESGFDPNARSSSGALGLTQLMPGTASSLGVSNPLDPLQSIEGGARYLSEMLAKFGGNTADALAAYNAGPGAVSQYGGVPPYPETQAYVQKVLGYAAAYSRTLPAEPAGQLTTPTSAATPATLATPATGSIA
jgi:soluble lytic murein transglycosylase-like protein